MRSSWGSVQVGSEEPQALIPTRCISSVSAVLEGAKPFLAVERRNARQMPGEPVGSEGSFLGTKNTSGYSSHFIIAQVLL